MSQRPHDPNGFTLVELLVVIAIIGTLVGLLLPAVQAARESARMSSCTNNLKQLALGLHSHHDARSTLPGAVFTSNSNEGQRWSWGVSLLPYVENQALYNTLKPKTNGVWNASRNYLGAAVKAAMETPLSFFVCPSGKVTQNDPYTQVFYETATGFGKAGLSNYAGNQGFFRIWGDMTVMAKENGPFHGDQPAKFKDITDGLSKTFLLGEMSGVASPASGKKDADVPGNWCCSENLPWNLRQVCRPVGVKINDPTAPDYSFSSSHPGVCLFAMADGAVRVLSENVESNTQGVGNSLSSGSAATSLQTFDTKKSTMGVYQLLGVMNDGVQSSSGD